MGDRRIAQHAGARTGAVTLMLNPQTEIPQSDSRTVLFVRRNAAEKPEVSQSFGERSG